MPTARFLFDTLSLQIRRVRYEADALRFFRINARRDSNNRHLALFAWALPPNSNAGVYRPLSFLQYGERRGWKIDAFHGPAPTRQSEHGESLRLRIPTSVRMHEVADFCAPVSYRLTPQIDGGFGTAISYADAAIRSMKDTPPSAVLASGPPFNVFISALFTAKHFGVPLILDYRDEWTECPFSFVSSGPDDRHWERRCLHSADLTVFTTRAHLEHQLSVFPELSRERTALIPNGWEANDFENSLPLISRNRPEKIRLAHIGTLSSHNLPTAFLSEIEAATVADPSIRNKFRIDFVGRRSPEAEKALQAFPFREMLSIVDHVEKSDASKRMQEADALLLIASPGLERYLPGKLFDYIAARRPILVFGVDGESSSIVDALKVGVHCSTNSRNGLVSAIHKTAEMKISNPHIIDHWLQQHRRDNLAASLFQLIDEVVVGR